MDHGAEIGGLALQSLGLGSRAFIRNDQIVTPGGQGQGHGAAEPDRAAGDQGRALTRHHTPTSAVASRYRLATLAAPRSAPRAVAGSGRTVLLTMNLRP